MRFDLNAQGRLTMGSAVNVDTGEVIYQNPFERPYSQQPGDSMIDFLLKFIEGQQRNLNLLRTPGAEEHFFGGPSIEERIAGVENNIGHYQGILDILMQLAA